MNRSLRIAVADDEAEMREYFRRVLQHWGHEVVGEADDGRRLVELCLTEQPDLIITDIRMPKVDGLEAISEIAQLRPTPVIIVSSLEPHEHDGHAQILAHLVKPISIRDLETAIARIMAIE